MQHSARRPSSTIAIVVLIAQLATAAAPALSFAQGGTSNVQRGQEYYEQSRFDEAIGLLKDLVDRGALQGDDLQHARELLARSYVKKGYPVQGKEMFKGILRTNPQWRPDPIRVPPDETAVFEQAMREFTAESAGGTAPAPGTTTSPPAVRKAFHSLRCTRFISRLASCPSTISPALSPMPGAPALEGSKGCAACEVRAGGAKVEQRQGAAAPSRSAPRSASTST